MDKSIEAAARAMYRYHNLREASNDAWRLYESEARVAIAAYRDAEIERLTAENEALSNWIFTQSKICEELRAKLEASNKELREIAESINDPRVNLTMTAAEWCVEAQAKLEAWENASQCGHPDPCTLGPLCPYCEIGRLRAKLEAAERDARRECLWVNDDDCEVWEGSCGVAWTFIDGGPIENQMKHCPQCGGHLTLDDAARGGERG